MKRVMVVLVVALLACVTGLGLVGSESVNVVWFRHRPWVLKYGPPAAMGHCTVRETADPASDVLSNLIDLESDGHSDYRSAGFIDGSTPQCERRVFLGFWSSAPGDECLQAARSCTR